MKFRSPDGKDVHIALLSGQTTIVTAEGVELDQIFRREAVAVGCIPMGMQVEEQVPGEPEFDRKKVVMEGIQRMINRADDSDFTKDGKPDAYKLSKEVGFSVDRHERDAMLEALFKLAE